MPSGRRNREPRKSISNGIRMMEIERFVTNHEPRTTNHELLAIVESDSIGWDAFTLRHPQGHLLQSSGWGALKQQVGWQARHVLVVGPSGPHAGAQLLLRR